LNVVLILEDDPTVTRVIDRALGRAGYLTIVTHNIAAANTTLANVTGVSVVIADYELGGRTTGIEFLGMVRDAYPHIRCILMSGAWRPNEGTEDDPPFDAFVSKPLELEEFISCVRMLCPSTF